MLDPRKINEVIQQVMSNLPSGLKDMPKDMQENFRSSLLATFSRMDLITREEFEVQTAVLLRTRSKLEALEQEVKQLEERLK